MSGRTVVLLVGLVCAAGLIVVIVGTEQRPLVIAFEAVAIGLLAYALTFAIRPRRARQRRRPLHPTD